MIHNLSRALIVDDEESFRAPLVQHLQEDYKYTVNSAASIDEARISWKSRATM